jgi:outer membrane protein assembly factor BamB
LRAAPTVANGRVYVVSVDNQAFAFDLAGNRLWSHTGILETAGLLGAAAPAADGSVVVVPYSSGELFALRAENGIVAWSDSLAAIRRVGALSGLADIRGMPVIDRGLVVAVSHSGRMAALDQRSGVRVWEREIGGTNMPWVAGDYVFVLSNEGEVVAMTRGEGRIRWVASLPRWEAPEDREGLILWSGPTLAGNRLWLVNNRRELVALSPQDGSVVSTHPLPGGALMAPIVANGTLYVLSDDGTLTAFR